MVSNKVNFHNGAEVHVLFPITMKKMDNYSYILEETNKRYQLSTFVEEFDRQDRYCMYSLKGIFIAYVNDDYIKIKLDDTYVVVQAFCVFQNKDDMEKVADGMLYLFRDDVDTGTIDVHKKGIIQEKVNEDPLLFPDIIYP